MTRGRSRDTIGVRLALMLGPVTLLLAAIELAFRLLPAPPRETVLERFVVPDPDLLWRLRPAAVGPLATNQLGLRDTPYHAQADVTVLVIGDSVTWGDGIDEVTRTYPYLLERRLSARHPDRSFEVVNAGVPGYTTEQEATWLERHGLALTPDAIVLQLSLNDVIARPPWLSRWRGREALRATYGFLLERSRAFQAVARAMQRRARAQETARVQALMQPTWGGDVERDWGRMLAQLDRIRALARERRIPMLLLVAPYRSQIEAPSNRRHAQARIAAWADATGIAVLDVLHELAPLPPEAAYRSFNDESHFSHLGHDLVADLLVGPVTEMLALDDDTAPDDDQALRMRRKASAYALADAAQAAGRAGALAKAAALLAEAARRAPEAGLVWQLQANVAHLRGDRAGAVRALTRGLALEPDNALFRQNLRALMAGRG